MDAPDTLDTLETPETPDLYPYQRAGAEWLSRADRGGMFDGMGLGKSAQAIAAADLAAPDRPLVVLCPSIVLHNWAREIGVWSPGRAVDVVGNGKARADAPNVVTTHSLFSKRAVEDQLAERGAAGGTLVVDEAHAFKSFTARRTQALYGVDARGRRVGGGLVDEFSRVWILTGTPTPNDLGEMWTHLAALWPERIRPPGGEPHRVDVMGYDDFIARYCTVRMCSYTNRMKPTGVRDRDAARKLLDGLYIRRTAEQVLPDLPPIRYDLVTLTAESLPADFAAAEREARATLGGDPDPETVLRTVGDSESMAAFRRLSGLAKVDPVVELLRDELRSGELAKVVIGAHHLDVIDRIREGLAEFGVLVITGAVPAAERQKRIDLFQTGTPRVMVGQLQAAGVGATLTVANEVVFAEMSFVPGENAQFAKRCHRIGQTRAVRVRCMALTGTIDHAVVSVLRRKTQSIQEVFST